MSIEVNGVVKSFNGVRVLHGVNLTVPAGKMAVLLGPSGCGKTTIMRCIAGLETPDSARITIDGRTVFDNSAGIDVPVNRRNVGMVFQSYAIWPHMTVFENVAFPLRMKQLPADEVRQRVGETLDQVGLREFSDRGSGALSGGQMQRVALARSLVMRPSVLLFDEPLSNLDARLRDRLRVQLRELQADLQITGIYVTHDQQEALALADEIVVIEHGRVCQVGDPVSIYNRPQTSRVADFLGYSNLFRVEREGGEGALTARLRDSGRTLQLDADAWPKNEEDCAICVRPDHVDIEPYRDGQTPERPNALRGRITLASFMGAYILYRVRSHEGEIWEVIASNIDPELVSGREVQLSPRPRSLTIVPVR